MFIHEILREKRKALGLTQEQVADAAGVSTPAVSKWESGASCPDIALLPVLSRILQTDPNTLLSFQDKLSDQEIAHFLNDVVECIQRDGVDRGFSLAMEKTREYPNSIALLHSTATVLDGWIMMASLSEDQKKPYAEQLMGLYEAVAKSQDPVFADNATYLLASKLIEKEQYEKAQEMLDMLPDRTELDKRGMQADLWSRQGDTAKAGELLERKLISGLQDHQATLCRLIRLAIQEGKPEEALSLANCAQRECEAFSLGSYWSQICPLEAAMATEDVSGSLRALTLMLDAAEKPWDQGLSPLFYHIPRTETSADIGRLILKPLLAHLEQSSEYEFLQGIPEFQELLEVYGGKYLDREKA